MLKRRRLAQWIAPVVALAFAPWVVAETPVKRPQSARLATFSQPSGETYFALSLLPSQAVAAAKVNEIVILMDTSASQAGAYREDSMSTLVAMLNSLAPTDRVQLMAVDLKAIPMTAGFVAPNSDAMSAAVAKLQRRVPLGATDLDIGLRAAMSSYSPRGEMARSVVYLGDGMSKANLLGGDTFSNLVTDLSDNQVSVSSFAIGSERNIQLLATLANHTGGMLQFDSDEADAATLGGAKLAAAARGVVIWPTKTTLPKGISAAYPTHVPPLRTDRDTILVGKISGAGPQDFAIQGEAHGMPVSLTWTTATEATSPDFAFLPKLVDSAQKDGGLTMPTLGSEGLHEVGFLAAQGANQLTKIGHAALATGNTAGALAAADAALARDPGNPAALAIRQAAKQPATGKQPVAAPAAGGIGSDLTLVNQAADNENRSSTLLEEALAEGTGSIDEFDARRKVTEQRVQTEVQNTLKEARRVMGDTPEAAEQSLKLALDMIERVPELNAETRAQLRSQLESAIRESARVSKLVNENRARAAELEAAARERERLLDETALGQQRLKQVMDRFSGLMTERKYAVAEEEVIPEIARLAPDSTIEASVNYSGRQQRHYNDMVEVQNQKNKNFVAALYQVELSHVPFPDEPPIIYTSPEKWEEITRKRKKYSRIDLGGRGSNSRIAEELNRTTAFEYTDTPLKDVAEDISSRHGIPVVLNVAKLKDAGIEPDAIVTKTLKGITLRSALRLTLSDLSLTYVERDEVLQITTPEDAEAEMKTKVYPVGDLVVPIITSGAGMMGGGMGGGMGGMGGGMNGGGGGMNGGGGMGGGMGGGGGGGLFAVEDDLSLGNKPATAKPAVAPQAAVKPVAPAKAVAPATKAPAEKPAKVVASSAKGARLVLPTGGSWDSYFAEQKTHLANEKPDSLAFQKLQADIRETVRQLMRDTKYDDLVALVQAALRAGQVQPWMYEAMGLAMQASGAPQEDLERALMSAVDFASSEEELIFIASYMQSIGLHQRALSLCQQVGTTNPDRMEAFTQGLILARQLKDIEGIRWACVGILRHSWPNDERAISDNTYRVAKLTYEELLKEGKTDEAKAFEKAIDLASVRDVLVRVTWSGDADVDISVEEPAGSVCTARSPRSASGGVFLGDSSAVSQTKGKTSSEVYVCSEAFPGEYRISLRSIWGRPSGGKVTLDIYTDYNTDHQRLIHEHIPMGEKNAVVNFDLKEGRRKEPLAEARVQNAVKVQNAVNRAVLAQQMAGFNNSPAALNYARSLGYLQGGGNGNGNGFFNRGAVGYRPVITTLREGASFGITAVVSADRRYVRLTPDPFFSSVSEVNTFNFVSGQGATQQNGQGGGGNGGFGGGQGGAGGGGGGGGGVF